jgi:hypothetical protein
MGEGDYGGGGEGGVIGWSAISGHLSTVITRRFSYVSQNNTGSIL